MPAGQSAWIRSRELKAEAEGLFELAVLVEQKARNFAVASASERRLGALLQSMTELGWTVLEDRLWPGSKNANVDFLLVGPGGVIVVDAKAWAEVEVRDGALYRGQSREDEEIDKLHRLVDAIADGLAETRLARAAITAVMAFDNSRISASIFGIALVGEVDIVTWLAARRQQLAPECIVTIAAALDVICPPMPDPSRAPSSLVTPRAPKHRASLPEEGPLEPLIDVEALTAALMESALAGPIEEWMTFLHPEQNKLIKATWNGPARIRGSAGTGKTVVGLHRATHLAQRSTNPVLFATFVRTLPVVLSALARRIAPDLEPDQLQFMGVHQLAAHALRLTERTIRIDSRAADRAFENAWKESGSAPTLTRLDARTDYWREEIDYVIKGRAITDFEVYRSLQRIGRKTALRGVDREAMWDLYEAYDHELTSSGAHDFNDLLIAAHQAVTAFPHLFQYGAVVVDELQDLNLVALRFLHSLAGEGPNPLLLIGDGQQSVYPGGFTLQEAGISVAGRAAVLATNYRNTAEILREAQRMVSADTFDDFEGLPENGARECVVTRSGNVPMKVHVSTRHDLAAALIRQITQTAGVLGTPLGDMAVLLERRYDVRFYSDVLTQAGIPHVELTDYDGTSSDRVKIGTIKRAKGLEFKYVLLPGLSEQPPPQADGETDDSYNERVERWRRELYVGMTRARDGLWLGYLPAVKPKARVDVFTAPPNRSRDGYKNAF